MFISNRRLDTLLARIIDSSTAAYVNLGLNQLTVNECHNRETILCRAGFLDLSLSWWGGDGTIRWFPAAVLRCSIYGMQILAFYQPGYPGPLYILLSHGPLMVVCLPPGCPRIIMRLTYCRFNDSRIPLLIDNQSATSRRYSSTLSRDFYQLQLAT